MADEHKMGVLDRLARLPGELQEMVYGWAGILSKYQHGFMLQPMNKGDTQLVIADALRRLRGRSLGEGFYDCLDDDDDDGSDAHEEKQALVILRQLPESFEPTWELLYVGSAGTERAVRRHFGSPRVTDTLTSLHSRVLSSAFVDDFVDASYSRIPALTRMLSEVITALLSRRDVYLAGYEHLVPLLTCATSVGYRAGVEEILPAIQDEDEMEDGEIEDPLCAITIAVKNGFKDIA
eukprot:jgi/Hompol1/2956/HPOL_006247-RA